jgi:hypothetical protein
MSRFGVLLALSLVTGLSSGCAKQQQASSGVPPELVADYVFAVISSDRATYAEEVVHRLQDVEKVIKSSEQFKEEKGLPLPSQMLRMGAQRSASKGTLRYALISAWAINKANMPKTDFEKNGLEALVKDPSKPATATETVNGKTYFKALYPDKAVSEACVDCHNMHAESPRTDFKLGEVMGGVVISFPVQ